MRYKGIAMEEIINIVVWVIGAVVIMTAIYHLVPFREWQNKKPKLVFFPKYSVNFTENKENVVANLKDMGFKSNEKNPNIFARGKIYGDFSAKALKLHVEIIESEKRLKVYAPFMGVFFDTGDIWSITSNAIRATES